MKDDTKKIFVIRRIKRVKKGGHHGGSWKIAYADFVTAMMAFFLLMWLLGLMNTAQRAGIAEYFKKPIRAAFTSEATQNDKDLGREKFKNNGKDKEKETEKEIGKVSQVQDHPDKKKQMYAMFDKKENGTSNMKENGNTTMKEKTILEIKSELENRIQTDPQLRQYKNLLNFTLTADGLKIELHDLENKAMFSTGKSDFETYAKTILGWLAEELNRYPNNVIVIGHTDTVPYVEHEYSNWELSSDRANATRRQLLKAGMHEDKIIRVVGVGDTELLNKENGLDPANRRIDIVVLTDDAKNKVVGRQ